MCYTYVFTDHESFFYCLLTQLCRLVVVLPYRKISTSLLLAVKGKRSEERKQWGDNNSLLIID